MQTQTQRPNFVCVCVSLRACVSVCVCMLSAMMSLLPESASPSAEMKELNSNSKPNETKTEEENGEKIRRRGCMRARKEEEMKRNCRGTNAGTKKSSHSQEICFYRLIFLLWAAENVKKIIIEIISVGWTSGSVTHPAAMLAPALLCSHWRSAAQQHQHHHTAAQYMTSPTSPLIGQQGCWAVIGPAGQRRRRRGGGGGVGLFQRKPPDQ